MNNLLKHENKWTNFDPSYYDLVFNYFYNVHPVIDKLFLLSIFIFMYHKIYLFAFIYFMYYYNNGQQTYKKIINNSSYVMIFIFMTIIKIITHYFVKVKYNHKSFLTYTNNPSTKHIFLMNHQSNIDFLLILQLFLYLPKLTNEYCSMPAVLSSVDLNKGIIGYMMRHARAYFVKRKKDALNTKIDIKEVISELLMSPNNILFFPEGTRSENFTVKNIKTGALNEIIKQAVEKDILLKIHIINASYQNRFDNYELVHRELKLNTKRSFSFKRFINTHCGAYYIQLHPESITVDGKNFTENKKDEMYTKIQKYIRHPSQQVLTKYYLQEIDDTDAEYIIQYMKDKFNMEYDETNTYTNYDYVHESEKYMRWNYWLQHYLPNRIIEQDSILEKYLNIQIANNK